MQWDHEIHRSLIVVVALTFWVAWVLNSLGTFDRLLHNCRYVIVNFSGFNYCDQSRISLKLLSRMYKSVVNACILRKLRRVFIGILFLETALFYRSVQRVCKNARIE